MPNPKDTYKLFAKVDIIQKNDFVDCWSRAMLLPLEMERQSRLQEVVRKDLQKESVPAPVTLGTGIFPHLSNRSGGTAGPSKNKCSRS